AFAASYGTSDRLDSHRAFLVVGLLRDRIGRIERVLIDELRGIEPRHEHDTARRFVAAAGLDTRANLAAPRDDSHFDAAANAERVGVVRMHEHDGIRERAIQLGYAAGHRAGVPMLEHAP